MAYNHSMVRLSLRAVLPAVPGRLTVVRLQPCTHTTCIPLAPCKGTPTKSVSFPSAHHSYSRWLYRRPHC